MSGREKWHYWTAPVPGRGSIQSFEGSSQSGRVTFLVACCARGRVRSAQERTRRRCDIARGRILHVTWNRPSILN